MSNVDIQCVKYIHYVHGKDCLVVISMRLCYIHFLLSENNKNNYIFFSQTAFVITFVVWELTFAIRNVFVIGIVIPVNSDKSTES